MILFSCLWALIVSSAVADDFASHMVHVETGRVLDAQAGSLTLVSHLTRDVVTVERERVTFTDYGQVARLGYGVSESLELRHDFHWITVTRSGHSGQFNLRLGGKYRLLDGPVAIAGFLSTGGRKVMGHRPWYYAELKVPVTLSRWGIDMTISPGLLRGLEQAPWTPTLEGVLGLKLNSWLEGFVEGVAHYRQANPRFRTFLLEKGVNYWAGLAFRPHESVRVPALFVSNTPGGSLVYGLVGISAQIERQF